MTTNFGSGRGAIGGVTTNFGGRGAIAGPLQGAIVVCYGGGRRLQGAIVVCYGLGGGWRPTLGEWTVDVAGCHCRVPL